MADALDQRGNLIQSAVNPILPVRSLIYLVRGGVALLAIMHLSSVIPAFMCILHGDIVSSRVESSQVQSNPESASHPEE